MFKNVKYCYELHNSLMPIKPLNNVSNKYSSVAGESSLRVDESVHVNMLIFEPRFFKEAINSSCFPILICMEKLVQVSNLIFIVFW